MIRLNDINKTVIDERSIKGYEYFNDFYYDDGKKRDRETISFIFTMGGTMAHYESKEARDKDIELLDKLFDVKSIEDKIKYNPSKFNPKKYDSKIQTSIYDFDINEEKESNGK